jgi:hypothetical protein
MTLLRRAPREVYRVYAEDDFFAGPALDEGFDRRNAGADRRLPRLAGGAMLLAAVGAVGGLLAIAGASSGSRAGRRVGSGLLAAANSLGSSRPAGAHVWRQPASAVPQLSGAASVRHSTPPPRPRRGGIPPRAAAFRGSGNAVPPRGVAAALARPVGSAVAAVAVASQPSAIPVAAVASAPGAARGGPVPGQSEFGFERGGAQ